MAGLRLLKVPIRFSFSSLLLVALIGWYAYLNLRNLDIDDRLNLIVGVAVVVFGFIFSIIWHELTHALVARRYGLNTESITLWGLGGAAQISGKYKRPRQMFWVSFAGPLSSFVLAIILFGISFLLVVLNVGDPLPGLIFAFTYLTFANVVLGIFNLIPALPLDGGRILHSIIWKLQPQPSAKDPSSTVEEREIDNEHAYNQAGVYAAWVGMILAIGIAALGFFLFDFWTVIIAGFIFMFALAEKRYYQKNLEFYDLQLEAEASAPSKISTIEAPIFSPSSSLSTSMTTTYSVISWTEEGGFALPEYDYIRASNLEVYANGLVVADASFYDTLNPEDLQYLMDPG